MLHRDRTKAEHSPTGWSKPQRTDPTPHGCTGAPMPEVCDHLAVWRHRYRVARNIEGTAYYCDDHLPVALRPGW